MTDPVDSSSAPWDDSKATLAKVRSKFANFLSILEENNRVLQVMAELEEKSHGQELFDIEYAQTSLSTIQQGVTAVEEDEFIIPIDELGADRAQSVGSKNAQLAEIKNRLGLPVPKGFAISAWAYKHFLKVNGLEERIADLLGSVNTENFDNLETVSARIRHMIITSPVPKDLAREIKYHGKESGCWPDTHLSQLHSETPDHGATTDDH